jgi:hypothetical protein
MSASRSAAALRTQLYNTEAEFLAVNSTLLPDGATAYVAATRSLYRLYKAGSALLAIATSGLIVAPDDSSGAAWVLQEINGASPWLTVVTQQNNVVNVVISASTWVQMDSGSPNTFVQQVGSDDAFQLNSTSSEITYRGPARTFRLSCYASVSSAVAGAIGIQLAIAVNDDIAVGSSGAEHAKGAMHVHAEDVSVFAASERFVELEDGDTIRVMWRNTTDAADLTVSFLQIAITPV